MPGIALQSFLKLVNPEILLAQVRIRREEAGFELRHRDDASLPAGQLRPVGINDLPQLAQFTRAGQYRPLRCAPNLPAGWICHVASEDKLEEALQVLYPGAVADWLAAQSPHPPVTSYRDMAARQTGMYRATALLTEGQAELVTRACCSPDSCLKRRMWTVGALPPDPPACKSLVPCLEPCAVLLEFARQAFRIEQQPHLTLSLAPAELATVAAALEAIAASPPPEIREADFENPLNPRLARLGAEKIRAFLQLARQEKRA